ncbi:hypothetical protein RYX36_022478 [Vicia faba]
MRIEREDMTKERDELRDIVKKLMESLNFQPKSYNRDQVHDDLADDNDGPINQTHNSWPNKMGYV